jgi:hypothetical protein
MDSVIFDFSKKQFFKDYNSNYLGLNKHLYNQLLHISKLTSVDVETLFYDIFFKQHLKIKFSNSTIEMARNWNIYAAQKVLTVKNIVEYLKNEYGFKKMEFDIFKNRKLIKVNTLDNTRRSKICTKNKLTLYEHSWHKDKQEYYELKYSLQDLIDHKYSKGIYHEDLAKFKKREFEDRDNRYRFHNKLIKRLNKRFLVKDFLSKSEHLKDKNIFLIVQKFPKVLVREDKIERFNFLCIKNNQYLKLGHSLNEDMNDRIIFDAYVL